MWDAPQAWGLWEKSWIQNDFQGVKITNILCGAIAKGFIEEVAFEKRLEGGSDVNRDLQRSGGELTTIQEAKSPELEVLK